jgi:hypothetical protein
VQFHEHIVLAAHDVGIDRLVREVDMDQRFMQDIEAGCRMRYENTLLLARLWWMKIIGQWEPPQAANSSPVVISRSNILKC